MSHTIELKKVSKYYATEESVSMGLSRIDLELDMGEFVAITGESGGGKSTLLNVISGLDTYEEGEMFVCGEDTAAYNVEDYEAYRKKYIGNIFQDFNLVNSYSVYQNIELVMLLCGKKKSECKERITELIELVGLTAYTRTKASKLSGGQKQRVAIARALAKDAPIIVADEPTGNLDSESAALVMETLAKVSAEKLVVIVTHNYEQAERYVTRKLTMHDGKIIEDKALESEYRKEAEEAEVLEEIEEAVEAEEIEEAEAAPVKDEPVFKNMGKGSELRLGIRNTFNIPSKFILLFIVYLFVATAVLGQYSSVKNSMNEENLLGYNDYFSNTASDRVVVVKKDGTVFSEEEIDKLRKTQNVRRVVTNDNVLDSPATITFMETYIEGPILPVSEIKAKDIEFGKMPKKDDEIVIKCDLYSDAYDLFKESGKDIIGKKVYLDNYAGEHYGVGKYTICGIIIDESEDNYSSYMGSSYIYVTDNENKVVLSDYVSSTANIKITYDKTQVSYSFGRQIFQNKNVPEGKMYIAESLKSYFSGNVSGGSVHVDVSNSFFKSKRDFEVDQIIKLDNFEDKLDIPEEQYDSYAGKVYINPKDYKSLFDKGIFQISLFVKEENKMEDTVTELKDNGYKCLVIKDTLSDATGAGIFIELLSFAMLIIEIIILFFISYAVIRLIMRSRNSYYSTLRILGASKKNTSTILRIELVFMMLIAYAVDIIVSLLVNYKIIDVKVLKDQLGFVKITDYIILGVVLVVMSILIANKYSRKMFKKSAMKTYREEV